MGSNPTPSAISGRLAAGLRVGTLARVLALAFLVCPTQLCLGQGSPEPLPSANLHPLHLLLLQSPDQSPQASSQVGLSVGYATVSVSESRGADSAVLDMEVARFSLRLATVLSAGPELWVEVPYLWFGGGAFDGPLIAYHDAIRAPDGGRKDRPRNGFAYSIRREEDAYSPDPPQSGGLGDAVAGVKIPVSALSDGAAAVAWRVYGKAPTGSPARGFGSGRADLGAGALASWAGEKLWAVGSLDGLWFGGTPDPALPLSSPWALSASAQAGWRLDALGTVTAGLRYLSSPYDTGLPALDRDVLMLVVGLQRELSTSLRWHLAFTEDLAVESSPDFCLLWGLEWSEAW